MIGSPAWRGATVSFGCGAERTCCAVASVDNGVSGATAASVIMAGDFRRPVAAADCAIADRFIMSFSTEMLSALHRSSVGDRGDVRYWPEADDARCPLARPLL